MKITVKELFDLEHTITRDYFKDLIHPWDILPKIKEFIFEIMKNLPDHFTEITKDVWVGKDTFIEKNAVI